MKKMLTLCFTFVCMISLVACAANDTGNSDSQAEENNSIATLESTITTTTLTTTVATMGVPTSAAPTTDAPTTDAPTTVTLATAASSTAAPTTNPPKTNSTTTKSSAPVDKDAAMKAELIENFGIPFELHRGQGFAFWKITVGETTVKREYTYVTADGETQDGMSWKIENGELVISGDWNETFILNIAEGKAISKKDGGAYNIEKSN